MANPTADFPEEIHEALDTSNYDNQRLGLTPVKHTDAHGKLEEEMTATQAKLGKGASTPTAGKYLKATGTGESSWEEPADLIGPTGPSGNTGPTGPQGGQGNTGNTGPQGTTGPTGPVGNTGAAGSNGTNGFTGATGPQGSAGNTGATGVTGGQGATGSTGPAGNNGAVGATGATGAAGSNGSDGAVGATGSTGPTGNTGGQGATGATGAGATGATGASGSTGGQGATGATGPSGSAGSAGNTGSTGPSGNTGATGPQGATGAGASPDWGDIGGDILDQTDLVEELRIASSAVLAYWDGQNDPTTGGQSYPLATMLGDATFIDSTDGVQLTPATNDKYGSLNWDLAQAPFMRAQFTYKNDNVGGADAMWFYCLADDIPVVEHGNGSGFTKGYIIYLSEYWDAIGITYGPFSDSNQASAGGANHPLAVYPLDGNLIADGNEHTVDISIKLNHIVVKLDGEVILDYLDVYTRDFTQRKLGFGARTGGINNSHYITGLVVFKLGENPNEFGIQLVPEDHQGSTGPTGPQGATGSTGSAGGAGATGATGPQGNTGSAGSAGSAGATGATGPSGSAGSAGATGATGPAGSGATGATGTAGSAGATGATGPAGSGATGATGTSGSAGTAGATGATGPSGTAGATGATGSAGATGAKPAGQLYLSAAGMWPSTTSGMADNTKVESATNKQNLYFLDASDSSSKLYCEATIGMPSDWDGGTVTAQFIWLANSTSTNAVVWGLQGRSYGDAETLDQAFGTAQEVSDANGSTANQVRISSATSAITLAGTPAAGELVHFRAYRDSANGSDTLAATARLIGIILSYTRT